MKVVRGNKTVVITGEGDIILTKDKPAVTFEDKGEIVDIQIRDFNFIVINNIGFKERLKLVLKIIFKRI